MDPREYDALFALEQVHWWFVALRREIRRALEEARLSPGARWLDAGCGTGGSLLLLAPVLDLQPFGLDASGRAVALASRRGLTRIVEGDAGRLPFSEAAFDCATSIDVLCHRDVDPGAALSELYRCLRPGGRLVLQVPAFASLRGPHDEAVWTSRRFRRGAVRHLLASAGYTRVEVRYRNALLFPAAALWRLARRAFPASGAARSDVRPAPEAVNRFLSALLALEERICAAGLTPPAGLSVFAVGERPSGRSPKR